MKPEDNPETTSSLSELDELELEELIEAYYNNRWFGLEEYSRMSELRKIKGETT